MTRRPRALRVTARAALLLALSSAACSNSTPTETDASANPDASSTPDALPDGTVTSEGGPLDAKPDADPTDRTLSDGSPVDDHRADAAPIDVDVGCACFLSDAGIAPPITTGVLSMPCYCAKQDWHDDFGRRPNCPTYDEAVTCPDASRSFHITTYKNCNLVTVDYDVGNAVDMRVYDATTHTLVGAVRGTDFVVSSCDASSVGIIQSGVVPGAQCEMAQVLRPCDEQDDAGATDAATPDAIDGSAACACTLGGDGGSPAGYLSIGCFCRNGGCLDYAGSIAKCAEQPGTASRVSIAEYARCNRTVVSIDYPSVFQAYFYDFTTHELLGSRSAGRDLSPCGDGGSATVFYGGDTTIDPSCVTTRYVERCPDRGDASAGD